jgi:uncharacterized protein (TIGR02588 family)
VAEKDRRDRGDRPARPQAKPSAWELTAAALGAAIVAATLGFMVYEAVTAPANPVPQIVVRVDTVIAYPSGHVVEFRAINAGDATAAGVQVQGELRSDTGVVERSESTVDFVPARSWRRGGVLFKSDPRGHRMEVRAVGFGRP